MASVVISMVFLNVPFMDIFFLRSLYNLKKA